MSKFEDAVIEATQWLAIPGVETIVANDEDFSIMILTSCSPTILGDHIPDNFQGFQVNFYYVEGLHVNKNLQHSSRSEHHKPVPKASNE